MPQQFQIQSIKVEVLDQFSDNQFTVLCCPSVVVPRYYTRASVISGVVFCNYCNDYRITPLDDEKLFVEYLNSMKILHEQCKIEENITAYVTRKVQGLEHWRTMLEALVRRVDAKEK